MKVADLVQIDYLITKFPADFIQLAPYRSGISKVLLISRAALTLYLMHALDTPLAYRPEQLPKCRASSRA